MAVEWWWWWWPSLPAWLGSEAAWFLVLNAVVAAIAVLSSRARPSASPRSGGGRVTRRASSLLLQRLRSFTIFSYPSAGFDNTPTTSLQPDTPTIMPSPSPSPRLLVLTPQPAPAAGAEEEEEEEEEEEPGAGMSMEDAYNLVLASRRPPEPEEEDEENLRQQRLNSIFNYTNMLKQRAIEPEPEEEDKENLRQQRLNSIFNYTQMLKQRALGAGRRQPDARRDQL